MVKRGGWQQSPFDFGTAQEAPGQDFRMHPVGYNMVQINLGRPTHPVNAATFSVLSKVR